METRNETKASPENNLRNRGADGNNSKKDMIFRADKIDLKNLDIQLEKHLSRVWSRSIEKHPKPKEEWEIELAKLEMRNVIARGAYGIVYKGIYDGQDVAVKVLDWGEDGYATTAETSALRASFRQEVAVWHKLDHPNVTRFVGASMGTANLKIPSSAETENSLPQRACCVVVEYIPGGTLKQYLFRNRRKKLAFKVVVQLALDLSRGLSYLHSERIVHRDVKTENMLLDYQRNHQRKKYKMFNYVIILPLALFLLAYKFFFTSKKQRYYLPPSPSYSLPILGHHLLIKPPVHRLFHRLSNIHGPIFYLRLGSRRAVVISSSSLARECFTGQNDVIVSNRPRFLTSKYIAYNYTTIATTSYGDHWRNLRRICSLEIVSSKRLANFLHIRKEEIQRMLTRLSRDARVGKEVELESILYDLTFNNIVRMVTGKIYYGDDVSDKEEAELFKKLFTFITTNSGARHPGEYLPFMKIFGGSFEKEVKAAAKVIDEMLQRLLDECKSDKDGNTMVNHLLSLQQDDPEYYTDIIIKGLMLGIMVASSETSALTIEWAMASLLNHPKVLDKVKLEIDEIIGQDRLIEESDIANLPYLQNVVSETLRLHPAAPVLVPRSTAEDIKIGGYDVPRDTMVMVNAWAIHRDPDLWTEPERFNPERFNGGEGEKDDVRMLIAFGSGRRICPGVGLAHKIVTLALGSLIQCFDWKKVNEKEIDMSEGPGMAMRMMVPLRALCKTRPIMNKLPAYTKV